MKVVGTEDGRVVFEATGESCYIAPLHVQIPTGGHYKDTREWCQVVYTLGRFDNQITTLHTPIAAYWFDRWRPLVWDDNARVWAIKESAPGEPRGATTLAMVQT